MWITKYIARMHGIHCIQYSVLFGSAPRLQVYEQNDNGYMLDETHGDSNPKKKREGRIYLFTFRTEKKVERNAAFCFNCKNRRL